MTENANAIARTKRALQDLDSSAAAKGLAFVRDVLAGKRGLNSQRTNALAERANLEEALSILIDERQSLEKQKLIERRASLAEELDAMQLRRQAEHRAWLDAEQRAKELDRGLRSLDGHMKRAERFMREVDQQIRDLENRNSEASLRLREAIESIVEAA